MSHTAVPIYRMLAAERETMAEQSDKSSPFDPDVLQGLYKAEQRPSTADKWANFDGSKASLARQALGEAHRIRSQEAQLDPGDAYLRGIADMHEAMERQALLQSLSDFNFDGLL